MDDRDQRLQHLFRQHAERIAPHADLFRKVAPQATSAHAELVRGVHEQSRLLRERWQRDAAILGPTDSSPTAAWLDAYGRLKARPDFHAEPKAPVWAGYSNTVQAHTLQPVRDLPGDFGAIVGQDRKLDVIGAPYVDPWTSRTGNVHPTSHAVTADPAGRFGFSQTASGNHCESSAALWVQFVPPIAPGFAQVRPFAPFAYQWASLSFKSQEYNSGGFGVLVLSWDMSGGDRTTERDHRYLVWNNRIGAAFFNESHSPSWEEDQSNNVPEWDYDYALMYGQEAPYFRTRPNRIYKAAIWCFGTCGSSGERPGQAIGRIDADLRWVVVGYQ